MIVINRALARLLLSVLRRSLNEQHARWQPPWLLCRADGEGLLLYAKVGMVGVAYRAPGRPPSEAMAFSTSVLDAISGRRGDEPLVFENVGPQKGRARWQDGNVPRVHEFATLKPDKVQNCPALPAKWAPLPPTFLSAFDEAAQTASPESTKFATARVQLHGKTGQIVATDSKQALLQSGFRFPWEDVVQVPSLRAFGLRELAQESTVRIARTEKTVCVQAGSWTFFLDIDTEGKPPPVHAIIPKPTAITCCAQIDPEDAVFLAQALPRLPGRKDDSAPVTLDLNRVVTVRSRAAESETVTEVELARSSITGTPQRLAVNRVYLERALKLGLPEIQVVDPARPVVFHDKQRLYVSITLPADYVLSPGPNALRICSATERDSAETEPESDLQPSTSRRIPTMPARHNNHHVPQNHADNGSSQNGADNRVGQPGGLNIMQLLVEVEQIRGVLQDALGRVTHLHGALKQYRRHGKAMEDAMKSLRGLNFTG